MDQIYLFFGSIFTHYFHSTILSTLDIHIHSTHLLFLKYHRTCEEVREFDGQDYSFLQSFLSSLQSSHIVPPDIWLLHYNSPWSHRGQSIIENTGPSLKCNQKKHFEGLSTALAQKRPHNTTEPSTTTTTK